MYQKYKTMLYKGKTFHEWEPIIGVPYSTIYCRYRKWKAGKFPEEDILHVGKIDSNSRPRQEKEEEKKIDQSWLYRPPVWEIEKLKMLYLNVDLTPYMDAKRG